MRSLLLLSICVAAAVGVASAQPAHRSDANSDGVVTQQEFDAAQDARFERLDADHDGYLAGDEFSRQRGRHRHARHERIDRALDVNGDGAITRDEFLARPLELFARADRDGDGVISSSERRDARAALEGRMEEGRRSRRAHADADHDGRISRLEFRRSADERFERADANHDGRLTSEEAAAARAAHERH